MQRGWKELPGSKRSRFWATSPIALWAVAAALGQAQTTINVGPGQTYTTIQSGINAAVNGDTVLVAPGTYNENINFNGKAITVTSSGGAAATIIDGGSNGPAITFKSGETAAAVISGFTIQHGGQFGFINSIGAYGIGNIYVLNSAPTILNNIITLSNCWGVQIEYSAPLIENNTISATQDPNGNCSFGGGAAIIDWGNENSNSTTPGIPAVIVGNTIENNTESGIEAAGGNGGAGVAVWGGDPVIEDNIFRNNASPGGTGGAITVQGGEGVIIAQNLIYDNNAGCGGGALAFNFGNLGPSPTIFVVNNTMVDNVGESTAGDTNCIDISQLYPYPDAYGESGPTAAFVNNIISGSTTEPAIDCSWFHAPSEAYQPSFDHNLLYNAGGQFFGSYCIDVSAKYGNIAADPMFVNSAGNNYHLQAGSPAIDAGNNSVFATLSAAGVSMGKDFDGNPRVQDATGKGYPVIDIGAYENPGVQDANPTTIILTPYATYNIDYYDIVGGTSLGLSAKLMSANGTPTGTVTFLEDGNQIGTSAIDGTGTATLNTPPLVPGVHNFIATYAGQGNFTPATSVVLILLVIQYPFTIAINSSPNPSALGQAVTFIITATTTDGVMPSPLMLTDNGTPLATLVPNASGIATYATSSLTLGTHPIEINYEGYVASDQQVVNGYSTDTSLISSLNPANAGQSVTFTATVTSSTGTPTGSVTFADGATTLGTVALVSGAALFSTSALSVGNHSITATYNASGSFAGSAGSLTETINGLADMTTLVGAPNPAYAEQTVNLTATVTAASGTPTGTVTFYDGGALLGTATLSGGSAGISATFNAAGMHSLTANYSGDQTFSPGTGTFSETVNLNPTAMTDSAVPNPAIALQPIAFGASVTAPAGVTATGSVIFTANGTQIGSGVLQNGQAAFSDAGLAAGNYQIVASYAGDSASAPSSAAPFTLVVAQQASQVHLATSLNPAPLGTSVTFTAAVSAAKPFSGTVQFYDGTNALGSPVSVSSTGTATYTTSALALGTHNITAQYSGDANTVSSVSAVLPQSIVPYVGDFSIAVTPTAMSVYTGQAATFQVTVTSIGGFNEPLSLSCGNLPTATTCGWSTSSLPNGQGTATVVIQTSAPAQVSTNGAGPGLRRGPRAAGEWALALLAVFFVPRRWRRGLWMSLLRVFILTTLSGCSSPSPIVGGTPPGIYQISITGTYTAPTPPLTHSAVAGLTVKSLF